MTVEEALRILRRKPKNEEARQIIALNVYELLLAYVASLLITFRIAPGETARDIVHDVLLAFYKRWPASGAQISSESALHAYLKTSCRNVLIDKYRHERKGRELVDFLSLNFSSAFVSESDLYRSIFLKEIIQKLPPECALLFEHYINEDLSPAEIAERLHASPAKFYSRWYRCIHRAKELLLKKSGSLIR